MSFKTLLVHVEAEPASDPRLDLAIDLANQFDAKLIGVGVDIDDPLASYSAAYEAGPLIVAQIEAVQADLKQAEVKFRRAVTGLRHGSDWRVAMRFPVSGIAAEACAADLVITSRGAAAVHDRAAWPGGLILQAGRPVLVAPPETAEIKASRVLVAWRDTREARRAVADAMPFLRRASKVYLVEICDNKAALPAATARLEDVAGYLVRHGITAIASAHIAERGAEAAAQFLDIAELEKVDLMVAGAFGHSRFQEWVFGGFTRALLEQTARAVLFSH